MKTLNFILITLLVAFIGCAGMFVKKPELTAEYYKTVYWGEEKQMSRNGIEYIGREFKTFRYYPEEDFKWVKEEITNTNSDNLNVEISLVWISEGSPGIGVCFDWLAEEYPERHDTCGLMFFDSIEDRDAFMNEFEGNGGNVLPLLRHGINIDPKDFLEELNRQIDETKDKVIGE